MKILHLSQFLGVGGLEKVLFLLLREQISAGHEVELLVYDYERSWVSKFKEEKIQVSDEFVKADGYDWKFLSYLKKKIFAYDIIHTHDLNPMMYIAPLKLLSSFQLKRFPRIIHTTHGMEHIHISFKARLYEKFIATMANKVVGVSPNICEYYQKKLKIEEKKLITIQNGTPVLDLAEIPNHQDRNNICKEFGLRPELPIFVTVARVVPLKDQALIIEAAKSFPSVQFLLIGPSGDKLYWDKLYQDLPTNVFMPGGRDDIDNILKGCDFFLSASRHEGLPISVLEAASVGLPCILSNIPGHMILQANLENPIAHFFETENLNSLTEVIKKALRNSPDNNELRQNLHKQVALFYSSKKMAERYLQIYRSAHVQ